MTDEVGLSKSTLHPKTRARLFTREDIPPLPALSFSYVLGITSRAQPQVCIIFRKATKGRAEARAKRMFA